MKVVAYCIDTNEKIVLAKANGKKHDITLISNDLDIDTVQYAQGKRAAIVCGTNTVNEELLSAFNLLGVILIISRIPIDNKYIENARRTYNIFIETVTQNSPISYSTSTPKLTTALENFYGEVVSILDSFESWASLPV